MHETTESTPKAFSATVDLLKSTRLKDVLRGSSPLDSPAKPLEIVKLTTKTTIEQALKSLAANNILSAPVSDAITHEYVGIIDVISILGAFLHKIYPELLSEHYIATHKRHSMNELQTLGAEFASTSIANIIHGGDLWYKGDAGSTLMEVVESGFRVTMPSEKVHHRVAIFDILPGQLTPDGPIPEWRVVEILSQIDVVRRIAHHMNELEKKDSGMTMSVMDVGLVSKEKSVATVDASDPTIVALSMMYKCRLSGLPTTTTITESSHTTMDNTTRANAQHHVVGNISASDIRGIKTKHFGALALPVGSFLLMMHPQGNHDIDVVYEDALVDQFPEAVKQGNWTEALSSLPPLVSCSQRSTVKDVIELMVETGKHRVYVKDDDGGLVGVITPTDVLSMIVKHGE